MSGRQLMENGVDFKTVDSMHLSQARKISKPVLLPQLLGPHKHRKMPFLEYTFNGYGIN